MLKGYLATKDLKLNLGGKADGIYQIEEVEVLFVPSVQQEAVFGL